ncbi:hypothetical protein A4X13_0g390 [Tilletia indica]|uniref:Uncharacterized protein n=1 Tax=Tilletia indica TaxID=43049 RepID=A0A177TTY9_9BASI|nr:hypothetical protein A4X13_0g390 [Tilletia indica]
MSPKVAKALPEQSGLRSGDSSVHDDSSSSSSSSSRSDALFDAYIASIRPVELPQLAGPSSGLYLDAAAAPPFPSTSLLNALHHDLSTNMYSNPHSGAPAARRTAQSIETVRKAVLKDIFDVDANSGEGWDLVFTSGATASLKLVAESFDWYGPKSATTKRSAGTFVYLNQSHTSLSGLRSLASGQEATIKALDEDSLVDWIERQHSGEVVSGGNSLLALPLQCNATGRRYIDFVKNLGRTRRTSSAPGAPRTFVLLDASSFLSSSSRWPSERIPLTGSQSLDGPDFIAFSFYKIFGYPTGLGGLLVRRDVDVHAALGAKRYFGGGTLALSLTHRDSKMSRSGKGKEREKDLPSLIPSRALTRRLEDGTLNFYGILAVQHAIDAHHSLLHYHKLGSDAEVGAYTTTSQEQSSWELRQRHVRCLTRRLYRGLGALHHTTPRGQGTEPHWLVELYTQSRLGQRWIKEGRAWAAAQRERVSSRQALQDFLNRDCAEDPMEDNDQGPIALFNLLSPQSTTSTSTASPAIISPFEVGRLATLLSIHLRVGRHCNAGVMEEVVGVSRERLWKLWNEDGVGCAGEEEADSDPGWAEDDVASQSDEGTGDDLGSSNAAVPTFGEEEHPGAAIRASLCTWNTRADVDSFLDFLLKFFVIGQRNGPETCDMDDTRGMENLPAEESRDGTYLQSMTLYPIKSCSGQHFGQPFNKVPAEEPTSWVEEAACDSCGCVVLRPSAEDDSQPASTEIPAPTLPAGSYPTFPSSSSIRSLSSVHSSRSDRLEPSDATGRSSATPPSSVRSDFACEEQRGPETDLIDRTSRQHSADRWPLTPYGLLHDREWCLVNVPSGSGSTKTRILSQKRHTRMALIRARVERSFSGEVLTETHLDEEGSLVVDLMREGGVEYERRLMLRFGSGEACERLNCSLRDDEGDDQHGSRSTAAMCAALANGSVMSDGPERHPCVLVQEVFSSFLDVDCTLARLSAASGRHRHSNLGASGHAPETADDGATDVVPILLSNESPFLMVCQESVDKVREWVREDSEELDRDWRHVNASSFRPNFVIAGKLPTKRSVGTETPHAEEAHPEPLLEDDIERLQIGPHSFGALGHCRRCEMVGIDQETGERVPEILGALSRRRRRLQVGKGSAAVGAGRVEFGEHLHWLPEGGSKEREGPDQNGWKMISVGMPVTML